MKTLLTTLLILSNLLFINAQSFHFVDTVTTLIKTTDQSPAHYYIEIYCDETIDTSLRWKAHFVNISSNWQISLDDQSNYHTNIQDGDSSDFTLYSGLSLPQKLIIGASLNNTTGNGSVFFDIYDPDNPAYLKTIEFRFKISQGTAEIIPLESNQEIRQQGNTFCFSEKLIGENIVACTLEGKILFSGKIPPQLSFPSIQGVILLQTRTKTSQNTAKFFIKPHN